MPTFKSAAVAAKLSAPHSASEKHNARNIIEEVLFTAARGRRQAPFFYRNALWGGYSRRVVKEPAPIRLFAATLACLLGIGGESTGKASTDPILHRTVDLRIGEAAEVRLSDGTPVHVQLRKLHETCDDVNGAVRQAEVEVEVDGEVTSLTSGTYHLPVTLGKVQIDCPITKGYLEKSGGENP
jgi:hypothetical protein